MSLDKETSNDIIQKLLRRNAELEGQLIQFKKSKDGYSNSVVINKLYQEVRGINDSRFADVEYLVGEIFSIQDVKFDSFLERCSSALERIFNANITVYIVKESTLSITELESKNIEDLFERRIGKVDIFKVYEKFTVPRIKRVLPLSTVERSRVAGGSLGGFLITNYLQVQGFLFVESVNIVDKELFNIANLLITNAILQRQTLSKAVSRITQEISKSEHDTLTGLYNKNYYIKLIEEDKNFNCVCMIDIDKFKWVNDTKGHSVGDIVLAKFGSIIVETLKAYGGKVTAIRFGGDEFMLMSDESKDNFMIVVRTIINEFKGILFSNQFTLTCSVGIAYNCKNLTLGKNSADAYAIEVKRKGKNSILAKECSSEIIEIKEPKREYDD